ncbi:hypothetical protein RAH57_13725 [Chryseobacterium sp. CKR4-1]|uniref:hypothetical protein n=1 Tax=Chryseobacterium sp. CKR4-1 TaxID=3068896 RepID=UPI002796BA48|nr:hypothetical protein [Chryseobacterium sp. CKR4-1]MDQ1805053.1 hypothetical protein [Chryseobacterium sp. CKR4-1]
MKKKLILFSFVLFFVTFCAGFLVQKGQGKSSHDDTLKSHFLQKSDSSGQTEIYSVSEIQDLSDFNDLEKVKFDFSILGQTWLSYFFAASLSHKPVAAVQNLIYITEPRYILYHSLQIAGC